MVLPSMAVTVTANFTTVATVPVTAASYTATGNTVSLSLGFTPPTGTDLMVVKNTGLGFITGRFSNLTQGQVVNLTYNGVTYKYVANYYGGSGNDLVLHWAYQDLATWGYNSDGQLGNNSFSDSGVPVNITASGALNGVSAITLAAGINHSLVLCEDGSLVSWGNNTNGQLGDGTTTSSLTPVSVYAYGVLAGQVVEKISAGGFHNLVACSDGTLVAFGMNTYGQLGNGGNTDSSMPVAVTLTGILNGKTVTALQAANAHSMALCSDGSIASWGSGSNGILGNGGTTKSNVPVAVTASGLASGEKFIALANGSSASHSMALKAVPLSSGSTLASLELSSGTLSPTFVAGTLSYATSVPSSTPSITVTPTVADATATVTVNGTLVASGSVSALIPLAVGSNTITVVGIPQDGVTLRDQESANLPFILVKSFLAQRRKGAKFFRINKSPFIWQNGISVIAISLTTYIVTATRAGNFDLWKADIFTNPNDLSDPAISSELAIPANDGITNLMKYALALSPMASATGNLPNTTPQNGYLTLTYRQSKTASDVTYTVQASDSLSSNSWTPATTVLSQTDPTPGGGSYWLVTVRDSVPYATHPQRFMRLQVVK